LLGLFFPAVSVLVLLFGGDEKLTPRPKIDGRRGVAI